ncbi:MAG: MinD/ParA family protein [Tissierellia bacterium]|nr:MinD/ParA family protein [Tissierellia bacterium]
MSDQAGRLREIIRNNEEHDSSLTHQIKVYSIISGKGGVGKTNLTVNLAIKLQQMGKRVLLLDADVGMSNAHLVLGIEVKKNLLDLIENNLDLEDIIANGPYGVDLISGGEDLFLLEKLDKEKQEEIIRNLAELGNYDVLLIDNGAGINKHSLTFTILADEIILITTPEPTSITDAYRILKAISLYELKNRVKVVINQVPDIQTGKMSFNKLLKTSEIFLNVELEDMGYIFNDIRVNKSVMEQVPIVIKYPDALASLNIGQISKSILEDKNYTNNISNLKQFKNRLIRLFG